MLFASLVSTEVASGHSRGKSANMTHQFLLTGINCTCSSFIALTVFFGALMIAVLTGVTIFSAQENDHDED